MATIGSVGACTSSLASASINGVLAGATIEVWKAWLTGIRAAVTPSAWNAAMARSTASVAPPITAWLKLLMFAMTTLPSTASTTRSISASGPNTAAIAPLSSTERVAISWPRALTASSAASKVMAPAATRAPYSPRLWPITMSAEIP